MFPLNLLRIYTAGRQKTPEIFKVGTCKKILREFKILASVTTRTSNQSSDEEEEQKCTETQSPHLYKHRYIIIN